MNSASDVDPSKQTKQPTEGRRVPPSTVFTRASAALKKKPAVEKQSKPAVEEKQSKPVVEEKQSKPAVEEKQSKPVVESKDPQTPSKPQSPIRGGQVATGSQNNAKIPRPESWEDDISRNTLDETPFTSLASPSSRPLEAFEETPRMKAIKPLLQGRSISEFINKDTWPIPTPEDREGYSAGFDEAYWLSGLEDYLKIMQIAEQNGIAPKSMMDFGCATGRVIRHFAAHSEIPEIWGTDINQRHVRWLYEHLPKTVKPVFNHCIPTLPIPDSSVDIITAFSVFTHIDTFETHWLAELSRIMSDDGMCYLTVHNEATWKVLHKERDNEENRLIQSIVKIDPEFKAQLAQPMPEGRKIYRFTQSGPYRAQVFHSNSYLHNVWGRFFDIEAIMPCHHVRQTVVVLRKKSE